MRPTAVLFDPPIAKAAHVRGPVVLLVAFAQDGSAIGARVLYGALMLQTSSVTWAKGLVANSYSGPRECPITVRFNADPNPMRDCDNVHPAARIPVARGLQTIDLQHYEITSENGCTTSNYPATS